MKTEMSSVEVDHWEGIEKFLPDFVLSEPPNIDFLLSVGRASMYFNVFKSKTSTTNRFV